MEEVREITKVDRIGKFKRRFLITHLSRSSAPFFMPCFDCHINVQPIQPRSTGYLLCSSNNCLLATTAAYMHFLFVGERYTRTFFVTLLHLSWKEYVASTHTSAQTEQRCGIFTQVRLKSTTAFLHRPPCCTVYVFILLLVTNTLTLIVLTSSLFRTLTRRTFAHSWSWSWRCHRFSNDPGAK